MTRAAFGGKSASVGAIVRREIVTAAILWVSAALAFAQGNPSRPSGAMPASEYIAAALEQDDKVAARVLALESASASLAALERGSFASFSAGTGQTALASTEAGTTFSAAPWIRVGLGRYEYTSVDASLAVQNDPSGSNAYPSVSVRQNLSEPLSGLVPLDVLRARYAVEEARYALASVLAEREAAVLGALADWAGAANEQARQEFLSASAASQLQNAKALGTYDAGSSALAKLESSATAARLALEKARLNLEHARELVAELCGFEPEALPPAAPSVPAFDQSSLSADQAIAVRKAENSLDIQRRSYADEWGKQAQLDVTLSYEQSRDSEQAALGASLGWDTLDATASVGWNLESGLPYGSLSLTWSPNDLSARASRKKAANADLTSFELALDSALADAASSLKDLRLSQLLEALEAERLAAAYQAAFLAAEEAAQLHSGGYITDDELTEAREDLYSAYAARESAAWSAAQSRARLGSTWILAGDPSNHAEAGTDEGDTE